LEGVSVISITDRSNELLHWHVCRRAYRSSPILSALGILYDGRSEDAWTCEAYIPHTIGISVLLDRLQITSLNIILIRTY